MNLALAIVFTGRVNADELERVCRGDSIDDFTEEERQLLNDFRSGVLLHNKNRAVVAFGHGTVQNEFGEAVEIGGSTGGLTRRLMALTPPSPLE